MGIKEYCPHCYFIFHGQRTGKCPNCDQSAYTEKEKFYSISPAAIRQFKEFDKKGGDVSSLRFHNKNIVLIQTSPTGEWVSLSVLGATVTFADYGKGPEIIAALRNKDGFGINDFPEKIMKEAAQVANSIIHG